jgi:hypothetical protein
MRRGAWVVLGVLVAGCTNELRGGLTAELKATKQAWSVTPDECASGQRLGFFGADVRQGGRDDAIVRALHDPKAGYTVLLGVPGEDRSVSLDRASGCATFDVQVEPQSSRINNITNVRGHIRLDCDLPEVVVRGDLGFANCH